MQHTGTPHSRPSLTCSRREGDAGTGILGSLYIMTVTQGRSSGGNAGPLRTLKMGMIGVGVGGTEMLPAMDAMPELELFAGADINPETRARFKERYTDARVYESAEAMCKDPDLEAVW